MNPVFKGTAVFDALAIGADGYGDELARGTLLTILLAVLSYLIALILGLCLGIIASRENRVLRGYWKVHSSAVMGVPPLLILFFVFFNLPILLHQLGIGLEVTPFMAGLIALGINVGTYNGEVFRGAILNLSAGQWEAARALGLKPYAIWRCVVLPQVIRNALPGLSNNWVVTLKETALVSLVGLHDLVGAARLASANTFSPFLFFGVVGLIYVLFGYGTMKGSRYLERALVKG